jgi:hypothetical protein
MQAAGLTHVSPGNRLASAGGLAPRPRACPNPQYLLSKTRVVKVRASQSNDEDGKTEDSKAVDRLIKYTQETQKEVILKDLEEQLFTQVCKSEGEMQLEKCTLEGQKPICKRLDFCISEFEHKFQSSLTYLNENVFLRVIKNKDGSVSYPNTVVALIFTLFATSPVVVVPVSMSFICVSGTLRLMREIARKHDV